MRGDLAEGAGMYGKGRQTDYSSSPRNSLTKFPGPSQAISRTQTGLTTTNTTMMIKSTVGTSLINLKYRTFLLPESV